MTDLPAVIPALGTISRRDREGLRGRARIVWGACPGCGKERWVPAKNPDAKCGACAKRGIKVGYFPRPNARVIRKKLSRVRHSRGYVMVRISPWDDLAVMATKSGYAMEHRIVMARSIGRPLERHEQVHHLNGIRNDNRLENLELWERHQPTGRRAGMEYHCAGCRCGEGSL